MSTQPFNAPDEASHYLRALSIANGQLLGPKAPTFDPGAIPPSEPVHQPGHPPRWSAGESGTRRHRLLLQRARPAVLGGDPERQLPAAPLPAAGARGQGLARTPGRPVADTGRIGAPVVAADSADARAPVGRDGDLGAGLLAAITPMVLFSSSVLNSSGPGITGSLVFGAAGLRLARDGNGRQCGCSPHSRWPGSWRSSPGRSGWCSPLRSCCSGLRCSDATAWKRCGASAGPQSGLTAAALAVAVPGAAVAPGGRDLPRVCSGSRRCLRTFGTVSSSFQACCATRSARSAWRTCRYHTRRTGSDGSSSSA